MTHKKNTSDPTAVQVAIKMTLSVLTLAVFSLIAWYASQNSSPRKFLPGQSQKGFKQTHSFSEKSFEKVDFGEGEGSLHRETLTGSLKDALGIFAEKAKKAGYQLSHSHVDEKMAFASYEDRQKQTHQMNAFRLSDKKVRVISGHHHGNSSSKHGFVDNMKGIDEDIPRPLFAAKVFSIIKGGYEKMEFYESRESMSSTLTHFNAEMAKMGWRSGIPLDTTPPMEDVYIESRHFKKAERECLATFSDMEGLLYTSLLTRKSN